MECLSSTISQGTLWKAQLGMNALCSLWLVTTWLAAALTPLRMEISLSYIRLFLFYRRETFQYLDSWLQECYRNTDQDLTIVLIGNKSTHLHALLRATTTPFHSLLLS